MHKHDITGHQSVLVLIIQIYVHVIVCSLFQAYIKRSKAHNIS